MQMDKTLLKKLAALVAGAIILNWLLSNFGVVGTFLSTIWGFLFPFVLGFIVAFLLNIPMRFIEHKLFRSKLPRLRRPLSLVLAILLVLAVVAFVAFMVVPQLVSTVSMLWKSMPSYIEQAQKSLKPYENYIPQLQTFIGDLNLDWQSLGKEAVDVLKNGAGSFLGSALTVAGSIVNVTTSFFIGVIFSIYLLLDKERMTAKITGLGMAYLPEKRYKKVAEITALVGRTFSKFVSGQCLEALAIALVFVVVLSIGRFDYALLIGVLIGFLSLIPIFGAFIGCAIGALLILASSGIWRCIAFVIVFVVVQNLDGNLMYPRIVGNSVGLPAVWVLVAVTLGAGLFGVAGMLLFIPLGSVFYSLLRRDALNRLQKKGLEAPQADVPPPRVKRKKKNNISK